MVYGVPGDLGPHAQRPVEAEPRPKLGHVCTEARAPALHMDSHVLERHINHKLARHRNVLWMLLGQYGLPLVHVTPRAGEVSASRHARATIIQQRQWGGTAREVRNSQRNVILSHVQLTERGKTGRLGVTVRQRAMVVHGTDTGTVISH